MPTNSYFDNATLSSLPKGNLARAENVDDKFNSVTAGFDKLPTEAQINAGTKNYATGGGVANAYTATLSHVTGAYVDGQDVFFTVPASNYGPSTLDVSGVGAVEIVYTNGDSLLTDELVENSTVHVKYSTLLTKWILMAMVSRDGEAYAAAQEASAFSALAYDYKEQALAAKVVVENVAYGTSFLYVDSDGTIATAVHADRMDSEQWSNRSIYCRETRTILD